MGGARESGRGEMEIIILEQQLKKKKLQGHSMLYMAGITARYLKPAYVYI